MDVLDSAWFLNHACYIYYLSLAEVGREFEAQHTASVITDEEQRLGLIEAYVRQFALANHLLIAHRLVLILGEVENMHLAIVGYRSHHLPCINRSTLDPMTVLGSHNNDHVCKNTGHEKHE